MVKVIIFKGWWTVADVQANPSLLFVFGDNDKKYGAGGQAIIRHEHNTCGIPTKKTPTDAYSSFYNDEEYDDNCQKIINSIENIKALIMYNYTGPNNTKKYQGVVFPQDNFGTGLAQLPTRAPRTFTFLNSKVEELKKELESM